MVQRKKYDIRKTLKNDAMGTEIGVDRAANEPRNRKKGRPSYRESESSRFPDGIPWRAADAADFDED